MVRSSELHELDARVSPAFARVEHSDVHNGVGCDAEGSRAVVHLSSRRQAEKAGCGWLWYQAVLMGELEQVRCGVAIRDLDLLRANQLQSHCIVSIIYTQRDSLCINHTSTVFLPSCSSRLSCTSTGAGASDWSSNSIGSASRSRTFSP